MIREREVVDLANYREGRLVRVLPAAAPPYDWEREDPYLKRDSDDD